MAPEGTFRVAQVRPHRAALDLRDALVAVRQLALEREVVGRLAGQPVEVPECPGDQDAPGRRRAGQGRDRVVQLVEDGVRELAHVVETRHGALALAGRYACLPQRAAERDHQKGQKRGADEKRRAVPRDRLPGQIGKRRLAGDDRLAREDAREIVPQLFGRRIAIGGLLGHRLEHDSVEIAADAPALVREIRSAPLARPLRLLPHHDRQDLLQRLAGGFVRPLPGHQLVEQNAERIDVGGGRDRQPPELLGARVVRRHRADERKRRPGRGRSRLEQLGDAEVEDLRDPSRVTSTLPGFRSRWTTRWRWAKPTARTTWLEELEAGARVAMARCRQNSVIGSPSTYSIAMKGWPSAVTPPSTSVTMWGCCSDARI